MKYYGEEALLSEDLQEITSDFSGLFVEEGFVIETTPSPSGEIYFRLMTGFPYYEDEDPADIKMTRISMLEPKYIKSKGDSWDLAELEKQKLNDIVRKDNGKFWKDMLKSYNNEVESINMIFKDIHIDLISVEDLEDKIPDYTKLK